MHEDTQALVDVITQQTAAMVEQSAHVRVQSEAHHLAYMSGRTPEATCAVRRDQFAAAALTGLLASSDTTRKTFEEYAACAQHHADALLAALDGKETT